MILMDLVSLNNSSKNGRRKQEIQPRYLLAVALLLAVATLLASAESVLPHPADRLKQHLFVDLGVPETRLTLAISGGLLATEEVIADLDSNADGQIDITESRIWLASYLPTVRIILDDASVRLDEEAAQLIVPPLSDFHLGLSPLLIEISVPVSAIDARDRRLIVQSSYQLDRTDFLFTISKGPGITLVDQGWPGKRMFIQFDTLASATIIESTETSAAGGWSSGGAVAKAKRLLSRPKTPLFITIALGVFVVMGALHALQPGHGKTLVAAYLVATGGTTRDAMALAGIVTFTHTISVFALGFLTLVASQVFLPSRVIPVLSFVSGLLVVAMGLNMLRVAYCQRCCHLDKVSMPHHDHAMSHAHLHHHRDHTHLTEEEHARLHLQEIVAVVHPSARGRRRVSMRQLTTLGVTGGLAPCPDALAILLLAVGVNQLVFGMAAIVAFSLGLAAVLVTFGLGIALIGPAWRRARGGNRSFSGHGQRLGSGTRRILTASPMISAAFVVLLGIIMLWRAGVGT
jgi:nickel/cobalt transporter (NicO) family protein